MPESQHITDKEPDMNTSRPIELSNLELQTCALYLHAVADTADHHDTSQRVARALRSIAQGVDRLHQAAVTETAALNAALGES